jgi:PTH1 family peptidyl-tRNA hydrolase
MRLWPRRHGTSYDLLVAGLGNPGREYAGNRHNVGWLVVDELARRHGGSWKQKFHGRLAEIRVDGHKVALLKPETYMNDSGRAVRAAMQFFKLEPDAVRHNGVRSVAQHVGTPDFLRLRVGVGRPERGDPRPLADWVLANFEPHEDPERLVSAAADAVELLDAEGLEATQRVVNSRRS